MNKNNKLSNNCYKCNNNILIGGDKNNICNNCINKNQRINYNDNLLNKYGYSINDTYENRIQALSNALNDNSKKEIIKHINALRLLQKSNTKIYNKLNRDIKWLQND
jgi:hypothetical protein